MDNNFQLLIPRRISRDVNNDLLTRHVGNLSNNSLNLFAIIVISPRSVKVKIQRIEGHDHSLTSKKMYYKQRNKSQEEKTKESENPTSTFSLAGDPP